MPQALKTTVLLKKFFGLKEGQTITGFVKELKALSSDEKAELADLAAVELGVVHDPS